MYLFVLMRVNCRYKSTVRINKYFSILRPILHLITNAIKRMKIVFLILFFTFVRVEAQSIVTDYDGNIYHTVEIGNQTWMVENLKVTHYNNGTPVPVIANEDESWSDLTTGALCWFENDSVNYKEKYGALYNYYAVIDERNICPPGWHIPTKEEWLELINFLGGESKAGNNMKLTTAGHWNHNYNEETNQSGFSAVPSGGRGQLGPAGEVGNYATWWASTSHDELFAWHFGLYPVKTGIRYNPGHKASGFSLRCIKD